MNPIWTQAILHSVRYAMKQCPRCRKANAYPQRNHGQYYKCKHCGHKFKEKGG